MKQLDSRESSVALLLMLATGLPGLASAQTGEEQASRAEVEEIIVTGSRIKRANDEAPVPIMDLTRQDLARSDDIDLSQTLRELPSIYEGRSSENSQSASADSGMATVELRNLGDDRTLVLIDGKRTVSNSFTNNSVSLSTIPSGFIDRVEVMTGGASAVYGSDAVVGVVNVITRDHFEGVEINARAGTSQEGDGNQYQVSLTVGANFHDDRGNVLVSYTADQRDGIYIVDRDWSTTNTNLAGDIVLSSGIPGGTYFGSNWFYDTDTNQLEQGFQTSVNGWDERQNTYAMRIPRDRNLFAAKVRYGITDNIDAVFQAQYSSLWTKSERGPGNRHSGSVATFIPIDNPFVPQEIYDYAIATGATEIPWRKRFTEAGNDQRGGDRDLMRVWLGLEGEFRDRWDWELFYGTHEFRADMYRLNSVNIPNFRAALDVEADPNNPGGYRCADPRASLGGCVPIDLFGVGSISEEAAEWIRHNNMLSGENTETQTGFSVSGNLMDLPSGPLGIAAGIEYRESSFSTIWDDVSRAGLGTFARQIDQSGTFSVTEAFIEGLVPVFDGFDLELAYRAADYDQPTVDKTSSYRFGANWQVLDSLRLRAVFATAERAPNAIELFSKGIGNAAAINDPCDGVTLATTGAVADNCRSVASVLANIQANGSFTRDTSSFVSHPLSGNLELTEERAETLTAGFVFSPSVLEGFTVSSDYYDIEIKDAVNNLDRQTLVDLCFENPNFDQGDIFCSAISREADTGEIFEVARKQVNVDTLRASGIDTTITYDFDLGFMPGDFLFKFLHSYVIEYEVDFNAPQGPITDDRLGEVPRPKNRFRATLGWSYDDWAVRLNTVMWGKVEDGAELPDGSILTLDPYFKTDLYTSRAIGWPGKDTRTELYFGISNLFDEDPPLLKSGSEFGGTVPTHSSYDIVGRYFYTGFRSSF